MKNKIIYDDNGRCYIEIVSKKHGIHLCEIDEADVDLVQQYKWCVVRNTNRAEGRQFVASTTARDAQGKRRNLLIHRYLMAEALTANPGLVVDHVDNQPLCNTRANLRLVTPQENQFNTKAKGYYWFKRDGKWRANIRVNGRDKHLGYYDHEEDAAQVYQAAKRELHQIVERASN